MHLNFSSSRCFRIFKRSPTPQDSYLRNRRYRGFANEVAVAQTRQDISVPIGRWVEGVQQGARDSATRTANGIMSIPGNVINTLTFGLIG